MAIAEIDNNFNQDSFNSVAPHPLQSWQWGEVRRKMGIKVIRIGHFQNNNLIAVFTMTIHKLPLLPFYIGYIPRSITPPKELINFLEDYGRRNRLIFIKFEPYTVDTDTVQRPPSHQLSISPHPLFPEWTQILDITRPEAELMSSLKPKTRYNIKVAQKKGVEVKEVKGDLAFEMFSRLYFQTTNRQKYHGHDVRYHQTIWQMLGEGIAHILVAFYNGEPLSAYELFCFKKTLYYPYGGSSAMHKEVMASNLLMWEAIRFGKRFGASTFDLWGSLPPGYDKNSPWAGFTRFKEGYGTRFVRFSGSFDLIFNKSLYKAYNIAYKVREKII